MPLSPLECTPLTDQNGYKKNTVSRKACSKQDARFHYCVWIRTFALSCYHSLELMWR